MCVVSMIEDHYGDKWNKPPYKQVPPADLTQWPIVSPQPVINPPTAEEIQEFRELLERAREYDKQHNEPDCNLEEKRQKLLDLAEELGIDISFV